MPASLTIAVTIWPAAILTRTDWPGAAFASTLPSAEIVKPGPAATTRTVWPADTDAALFSMSWRSGSPAEMRASAVALAGRVIAEGGSDPLDRAYRVVYGRGVSDEERAAVRVFLDRQAASYRGDGKADADKLALADACQALLASDEFVYVP